MKYSNDMKDLIIRLSSDKAQIRRDRTKLVQQKRTLNSKIIMMTKSITKLDNEIDSHLLSK